MAVWFLQYWQDGLTLRGAICCTQTCEGAVDTAHAGLVVPTLHSGIPIGMVKDKVTGQITGGQRQNNMQ